MTFDKPKNIGLITMCKYIDDNIYTNNYDEYTAYTYIYHIIYDVAKHKLKLSAIFIFAKTRKGYGGK